MGKFITLREEFESETGAESFADQQYIEWLEKVVERQRQAKNCSISFVRQSEHLNAFREWTRENLNQEDVVTQEALDRYLESL